MIQKRVCTKYEFCINEAVQHQCTSPPLLVWRILDDQGSQLGAETYSTCNFDSPIMLQPIPGADGFSTALISSGNTLVSNISFSASETVKVSMATQYSAYKLEGLTEHVILS